MSHNRFGVSVSAGLTLVWILAISGCGGGGGGGPQCTSNAVPSLAGTWFLDSPSIASSDCDPDLTSAVEDLLTQAGSCQYQVSQNGSAVDIDNDCGGSARFQGCVDEQGTVNASWNISESDQGCTVSSEVSFAGDLSSSPASPLITFPLQVHGDCGGAGSCTLKLNVRFARSL